MNNTMSTSRGYKKKASGHGRQWSKNLRNPFKNKEKGSPMNSGGYYNNSPLGTNGMIHKPMTAGGVSTSQSENGRNSRNNNRNQRGFGRRRKNKNSNNNNNNQRSQSNNRYATQPPNGNNSFTRPLSPEKGFGGMLPGTKFTQMDPKDMSPDQVKMIQMELDRLSLERTRLETELLLRQKQVHQMEDSLDTTSQQSQMLAYEASQQKQKVIELERALNLKNKQLSFFRQSSADKRPTNLLTILPIHLRKKFSDFLKNVLIRQRPQFEDALGRFIETAVTDKELPKNCTREQIMREIIQINNSLIDDYVNELELRLNGTFKPSAANNVNNNGYHGHQESLSNTQDSILIHHDKDNSSQANITAAILAMKHKQGHNGHLGINEQIHDKSESRDIDDISALSKDYDDMDDISIDDKKESSPPGHSEHGHSHHQHRHAQNRHKHHNHNHNNHNHNHHHNHRHRNTNNNNNDDDGGHTSEFDSEYSASDDEDDEDEFDINDDPDAYAMQQEMAAMFQRELQKSTELGGMGGSDGVDALIDSFMTFNKEMEKPETAPDMFSISKQLREKPYLELRDLLESLPYDLSNAILHEQETNYPNDRIKDVMIQRGCWPMIRFQTRRGKIIQVNLPRTVPFSDVLAKLETYLGLNKSKKLDPKYVGNHLLGTFDPQHTTGFRLHMITGVIRQRTEAKHEITALNLRVGRLWSVSDKSYDMLTSAIDFYESLDKPSLMLVLGPNTAEKCALLREISRLSSTQYNIRTALVDTRSSVAGYTNAPLECGQAVRYYVNSITNQHHVIDETRSIYPQCVIIDEVLNEEDINVLQKLQSEGISLICGTNMQSLQTLMGHSVFSKLLPPQDRASSHMNGKKDRNTISFMSAFLVVLELNYTATELKVYKNVPAACKAISKNLSPPCDNYSIEWVPYNTKKHTLAKAAHGNKHARSNSKHINKLIKKSYRNLYQH